MRGFDLVCFKLYRENTKRTSTCRTLRGAEAALRRIRKQGGAW